MKQEFYDLQIKTNGQKLYEFTNNTIHWIGQNNFKNGILNLSIQHTSASLICLLYTSPSPRDLSTSRMPSSA